MLKSIISSVINQGFIAVTPEVTMAEALALMSQTQTSCLLVVADRSDNHFIGLFTESDAVGLVAKGVDWSNAPIASFMSDRPITIKESEVSDLFAVVKLMLKYKIRHLPVVGDDDSVIGLIDQTQMLEAINQVECWEKISNLQSLADSQSLQLIKLKIKLQSEKVQRNLIEKKLQSSETKMRGIFGAMNDVILIVNTLNRKIAGVEVIPSRYFDLESDLVVLTIEKFYEQSTKQKWLTVVDNVLQGQKTLTFDYCLQQSPDEVWFSAGISPFTENSVLWVARDISRAKRSEQALLESRHLLHAIADANPNILYVYDLIEKRSVYCNREIITILGYNPEELQKMEQDVFSMLVHPDDFPRLVEHVKRFDTAKNGEILECEYRTRHKNGEWRWLHSREVVFKRTANAKPKQILGAASDISDRKRAEQELQRTQSQLVLQEKMASLGSLVAGVAHEINNPTSFIYGNIEPANDYAQDLLELIELYRKYYPQPVAEIVEKQNLMDLDFIARDFPKLLGSIQEGANRISEIVKSLRNFSRYDRVKSKQVDIHSNIDNTLLILKHRVKQLANGQQIEIIKEYGELPLIECYPSQLNQVFMNLLCNAIDALEDSVEAKAKKHSLEFATSQPQIRIRTAVRDEVAVIKIADNAGGINPEVASRIFDPFFTTKPPGKGTGLGLSISYKIIVEQHCGQIACNSTIGEGTEFTVELPLASIP